MSSLPPAELIKSLASHPRGDDVAKFVRACLLETAAARSTDFLTVSTRLAEEHKISREDAQAQQGNPFDWLSEPSATGASWMALLLAKGLQLDPPQGVEAEDDAASRLVWLTANAPINCFAHIDDVLGTKADGLWGAVADLVQRHDVRGAGVSRSDAIVAAASLASSKHPKAQQRCGELASSVKDPMLAGLLSGAGPKVTPVAATVKGELTTAPRGPLKTFLLGLCGWLLISHLARLIARYALQVRRPAEMQLTARGIVVKSHTKLLGKTIRESETIIPVDGLARATREVKFPRMGAYAGLIALALGSYFGVSWFIDGVRAMSLSLAAVGLLVLAVGIALDFALMSLLPGRKGMCRVLLIPRRGPVTCVGDVDIKEADATLSVLARRA